jgi:GNAT superfamily N-acetyltransferase
VDIRIAFTEAEIQACFPALYELRPYLLEKSFVEQIDRQMRNHGYVLVYIASQDQVGRPPPVIALSNIWPGGRTFYVDDLISRSAFRKQGYGGQLLDWLLEKARELSCDQFHLDSGVHRHDAHRLYLSRKLQITSHHLSRELGASAA